MFQGQVSNKIAALGTIADLISPVNSQLFGLILILLINLSSEQAEKRATRSNLARYAARQNSFFFQFSVCRLLLPSGPQPLHAFTTSSFPVTDAD